MNPHDTVAKMDCGLLCGCNVQLRERILHGTRMMDATFKPCERHEKDFVIHGPKREGGSDEDPTEEHWTRGHRAAWRSLLGEALRHLGYSDPETVDKSSWILEREDTVTILRQLCEEFGDLDWERNLHLGDIIEKHLIRHIRDGME